MNIKKAAFALFAMTVSGAASAATTDNISVGFIEAENLRGITISADKSINDRMYLGAELQSLEHQDIAILTANDFNFKVGALRDLTATHDLYGEVGYGRSYLDVAGIGVSDDYLEIEVGVKGDLSHKVPVHYSAFLGGKAYDELGNAFFVGADVDYALTDNLAIGVGYKYETHESAEDSLRGEKQESEFLVQAKFLF